MQRASGIRFRVDMPVMLVRVDDARVAALAEAIASRLLRVRHPIPAVQRIGITEPLVILVGPSVRAADMHLLLEAADAIGAELVNVWDPPDYEEIEEELQHAFGVAAKRRFAAMEATEREVA